MTADAYGGGVAAIPQYIEDVFSTWLYTGTGAAQTITNGVDLSTKGGMVWMKNRTTAYNHAIVDSARGLSNGNLLITNLTNAAQVGYPNNTAGISSFNTDGFTLRSDVNGIGTNYAPGDNIVSWTFRKQPKFFDVVTYTGTGSVQNIAHNLGSVPGCIIIKNYTSGGGENWNVYHRSLGNTSRLFLDLTSAAQTGVSTIWNATTPTDTVFTVGTNNQVNTNGASNVAYLFAHDAGGFGLTGTDNVISCGSYTTNSSAVGSVTLGWEPQWVLLKASSGASDWLLVDNMRGFIAPTSGAGSKSLSPNTSAAESTVAAITVNATGFVDDGQIVASGTVIYIAIRRGPMKVPTDATTVFGLSARSGTGANATVTGGQTDDVVLIKTRGPLYAGTLVASRLTGTGYLLTTSTNAEVAADSTILQANPWDVMDGVKVGTTSSITNASGSTFINYLLNRAPGFFDQVCYTGTGSARTVAHNLGVAPELMIVKNRGFSQSWYVYAAGLGNTKALYLDSNQGSDTALDFWNNTTPTASVFTVGSYSSDIYPYVAYLFATCPGVSKVGSYTGNGTTQTVNCGFTGGARFVLIKRSNAYPTTGDWYFYDTARGMTTLTDPYLRLNSVVDEVATLGSVTTVATGFALNSAILAAINVSAGTYIFLAIA